MDLVPFRYYLFMYSKEEYFWAMNNEIKLDDASHTQQLLIKIPIKISGLMAKNIE